MWWCEGAMITYPRRSMKRIRGCPSLGSNPPISTTSLIWYRQRPFLVVTTISYRFPLWSSHYEKDKMELVLGWFVRGDGVLLDEVLVPTQVQ
jgi:hypothetical protein